LDALEVHDFGTDPLPALSGPILATHRRQDALAFWPTTCAATASTCSVASLPPAIAVVAPCAGGDAAVLAAAMILLVLLHHGLEIRSLQKQVDQATPACANAWGGHFPDLGAAGACAHRRCRASAWMACVAVARTAAFSPCWAIAPVIGRTASLTCVA
jgi:hypothetical protein